jgi:hypothetical protein
MLHTVTIQKPDDPIFKWSFFGHNLCPLFECLSHSKTRPKIEFPAKIDHFIQKKNNYKTA